MPAEYIQKLQFLQHEQGHEQHKIWEKIKKRIRGWKKQHTQHRVYQMKISISHCVQFKVDGSSNKEKQRDFISPLNTHTQWCFLTVAQEPNLSIMHLPVFSGQASVFSDGEHISIKKSLYFEDKQCLWLDFTPSHCTSPKLVVAYPYHTHTWKQYISMESTINGGSTIHLNQARLMPLLDSK
jgi:hypothetical protein